MMGETLTFSNIQITWFASIASQIIPSTLWLVYKKVVAHQAISKSNSVETTTPLFVFFAHKMWYWWERDGKQRTWQHVHIISTMGIPSLVLCMH
jgi:hypothetical protein